MTTGRDSDPLAAGQGGSGGGRLARAGPGLSSPIRRPGAATADWRDDDRWLWQAGT